MANFVLVHGAWHGGWCWVKVVEELQAAGHVALAPDLPSHGSDPTSPDRVDLGSYVERICDVIDSLPGQVVLVGHSLGGLTISQVAELRADRLARLVYLAAFVPESGVPFDPAADIAASEVAAALRPSADGTTLVFDVAFARQVFYADCSDEDVRFACERLCAQPASLLGSQLDLSASGYGRVPRDYIVCLQDRALPLATQRGFHQRARCANVYTLDTSHSPFFSAPAALAKILGGIADS
jgi:pimeloyl-ACP methyl ester carboxylesterase